MSLSKKQPALTLDLDGAELTFHAIPAGSFYMGSRGNDVVEEPFHRVEITQPFYLGTYPVTQAQFSKWRPDHVCGFPGRPSNPVERVDWHEANDFCQWLNDNFGHQLPANYSAGLPTEAQWEYACRAGTVSEYYTGDGESALASIGWYDDNSNSKSMPVGLKEENGFGLCDTLGNVSEWCADLFDPHAYKKRVNGACDPFVAGNHDRKRVVRGGSCYAPPSYCRAAFRFGAWPEAIADSLSFRVCLSLVSQSHGTSWAKQASVSEATRKEEDQCYGR